MFQTPFSVSTFGVASPHQPTTDMSNSLHRFGLRRPESGMSGLGAEIKRHERLWIDTSDHEFVEQFQPSLRPALCRPASETRCTAVRLRLATTRALDASRINLLEQEEALLAPRNFESRHTCHSHRSMPGISLSQDHQPARRIEN
jgi:hypothetical protein